MSTTGIDPEPCSVCGKLTVYCCANCMIDNKKKIHVCISSRCRDAHEQLAICNQSVKI